MDRMVTVNKICKKCKISKPTLEFYVAKNTKDKLRSKCIFCYNQDNYHLRKEAASISMGIYRQKNKAVLSQKRKAYYEDNKEKQLKQNRIYVVNNLSAVRSYGYNYRKERRKTDKLYKLQHNLRSRIGLLFRNKAKPKKTFELLGTSLKEIKKHLESLFSIGMTWQNHGIHGWHIDHIIPLASAKTEEELYKLCHYTNLQPLWAVDNLKKGSKIK